MRVLIPFRDLLGFSPPAALARRPPRPMVLIPFRDLLGLSHIRLIKRVPQIKGVLIPSRDLLGFSLTATSSSKVVVV